MPEQIRRTDGSEIQETALPGVGVRYEFTSSAGVRVAVVHHRSGRRELILFEPDDPDCVQRSVDLDEVDSRTLAEMLGASKVAEHLARLQQSVEGLAIDWLPIGGSTPFAGRTIGDTQARSRTGVSIVAVLRGESASAAPGPEEELRPGDTLVVVGTARGIEQLAEILRSG
ncbi:MAG TPA: cation:proton antiporter regulatory subunit [Actinomycetota bacterium]